MSGARMTQAQYRAYLRRKHGKSGSGALRVPKASKMSHPEWRYLHGVLGGNGAYEGETLRITPAECEDHSYTPDFVTWIPRDIEYSAVHRNEFGTERTIKWTDRANAQKVYHEVKGSYRLKSQDGARLRWCFAAISRPDAIFVWSKENKDRTWDIEIWFDGGRRRDKERGVVGFKITKNGGVTWQRK